MIETEVNPTTTDNTELTEQTNNSVDTSSTQLVTELATVDTKIDVTPENNAEPSVIIEAAANTTVEDSIEATQKIEDSQVTEITEATSESVPEATEVSENTEPEATEETTTEQVDKPTPSILTSFNSQATTTETNAPEVVVAEETNEEATSTNNSKPTPNF